MKKLTVALISGGTSSERKVSVAGGDHVYDYLNKDLYHVIRYDPKTDIRRLVADAKKIDVAFVVLHGLFGEDGSVQGLLDLLDIPYQCSGVLGSALAMNKIVSKKIYDQNGLPVPPYTVIDRCDKIDSGNLIKRLGLPLVVKPATGGSSIGMKIAFSKSDMEEALEYAFEYDKNILIEKYIKGVEITAGVLGNNSLKALPVVEIIPDNKYDFFNYEAKYNKNASQEICPARISEFLTKKAQQYGKDAHRALFCKGYSRTDMIIQDNDIYLLETNTVPGMTPASLFPLAAKNHGLSFDKLLDRLISLALNNHKNK